MNIFKTGGHHAGNIFTGCAFNHLEAGARVYCHHHRARVRPQHIDASQVRSHDGGRPRRARPLFGFNSFQAGVSAALQVRTKFAPCALALHHCQDFAIHYQASNIGTICLLDKIPGSGSFPLLKRFPVPGPGKRIRLAGIQASGYATAIPSNYQYASMPRLPSSCPQDSTGRTGAVCTTPHFSSLRCSRGAGFMTE